MEILDKSDAFCQITNKRTITECELMTELKKGFLSGEENGWLTEADVDKYFEEKHRKAVTIRRKGSAVSPQTFA